MKWALLGASRGFGQAFLNHVIEQEPNAQILAVSRSAVAAKNVEHFKFDLSNPDQNSLVEKLREFSPDRIVYFAGGGPYGSFSEKAWKDHLWALRVTFLSAAEIFHTVVQQKWPVQQLTFIGSAVAESQPDANASSYAAAKHALRGLIMTAHKEKGLGSLDLRLFSPGYMDTQLLPANAWPRYQAGLVKPAAVQAQLLYQWLQDTQMANAHLVSP